MAHVRFRWRDPATAAEIANAHAKQYIEQSLEKRFVASEDATKWLDEQLADERKRVEATESALQAYREKHDALSLQDGQNIVVQKLGELNAAVTRAKTARIEKETQYRSFSMPSATRRRSTPFQPFCRTRSFSSLKASWSDCSATTRGSPNSGRSAPDDGRDTDGIGDDGQKAARGDREARRVRDDGLSRGADR